MFHGLPACPRCLMLNNRPVGAHVARYETRQAESTVIRAAKVINYGK